MQMKDDTYGFFEKNIAHIEVLREDQNLEKIYFYLLPFTRAITKDTKIKFNREVPRISSKSKVNDLLEKSGKLIDLVEYEYK